MATRSQLKSKGRELAPVLRPHGIGREDHELLTFTVSWLPYGGPPSDELLVRFGLTRERYLSRLRRAVAEYRRQIHPTTAARLLEVCDTRKAQASQAVPHSAH
ncbi:hypothetical protein [Mycolicibacterium agri]|uniref:DUF3263 domain-containing protein n=1 Tax=Mycolicibacterium agri TaxID=36811 RepID=A0A7I9W2Q7_MYCAG|nr:hypothetical protein [Mycolicibacterium agri]GFG51486.1 hypothetical protein MAGR_29270 [Mycolicibacterium agri]